MASSDLVMSEHAPNKQATNEEIIDAVRLQVERSGGRVATTKAVAEAPTLTISKQQVRNRLRTLADEEGQVSYTTIGEYYVWWVPEEKEPSGEVDFSNINWENINPEDIPTEKIEQHPDYGSPGFWDERLDDSQSMGRIGMLWAVTGFTASVIIQSTSLVETTQTSSDLVVISIIGGFVLILLGAGLAIISQIVLACLERGVVGAIKAAVVAIKSYLVQKIPISVSVEWKSDK